MNLGNLLYVIAVILVISWAVSYFALETRGGLIHLLLVIAVIVVLLRIIFGSRLIK